MKQIILLTLVAGLIFCSCNSRKDKSATVAEDGTQTLTETEKIGDREDIRKLIRQTMKWAQSENSIELFPVLADDGDSLYIGFDLERHKQNLDKLRAARFFADTFISDYDRIILTLDKGIRNGKFEPWLVGDLPPFVFGNGTDPWCLCQDVPFDEPDPWDHIDIEVITLDNHQGELNWKWGGLEENLDPTWTDFAYRFRTVKENGKWKISYLQGFDLKETGL